ncbi:MAG: flagellar hook-associated protein FlgL [Helicobacter sp.]|nr:flagellar hook-associated protein FlgL [Helicobacter sp.]
MRITFGQKYNQMDYNQKKLQNKIFTLNNQIASGTKIQKGYQDANIQNQDLKLSDNSNILKQNIDLAKNSQNRTLNTDKALSGISESLVTFKTKLLNAINDSNTPATRNILANELKNLKSHMINIANTSINGEYIFGGTNIRRAPFDANGNYYGNSDKLKSLIGQSDLTPYNINGEELFLGKDIDKTRQITTNIKKLNQSALHPDLMQQFDKHITPKQAFITANDSLRDLIGDNDDNPANDSLEYFYINGVDSKGLEFKTKFSLDKSYGNREYAIKVQALLDKIAQSFGNTQEQQVVDVSLNDYGQIEISDLNAGASHLQFHMISSDKDVQNIEDLYKDGARITFYNQSPLNPTRNIPSAKSVISYTLPYKAAFQLSLIDSDNKEASAQTPLKDLVSFNTEFLEVKNLNTNKTALIEVQNHTLKDLMSEIKELYGKDFEVEIEHGELSLIDLKAKNSGGKTKESLEIKAFDGFSNNVSGLPGNFKANFGESFFQKQGNKLISNIPQITPNESAKDFTKLSDLAKIDLVGESFDLHLTDHSNKTLKAQIMFKSNGAFLVLPSKKDVEDKTLDLETSGYLIPLFGTEDAPTKTDKITYRQLMDAFSIALSYSNQSDKNLANAQNSKEAYQTLLNTARGLVSVNLDKNGLVEIEDKLNSKTNMNFSFYNTKSGDFSKEHDGLLLNANNALQVTDPKIDFFKQLDLIIQSVERGISQPDSSHYDESMRDIGMQNGIKIIDNLADHIERKIALNGSYGKRFERSIEQNEILKTQIDTMRADNIGIDMAQTYNHFNNVKNNYEAMLSTANRVKDLSLANYI